jgi:hypothetical protein
MYQGSPQEAKANHLAADRLNVRRESRPLFLHGTLLIDPINLGNGKNPNLQLV